jgi:hypothetical protein
VPRLPDGAIHWVSEDGSWHDFFYPGYQMTGLEAGVMEEDPVLVLASEGLVEAWKLTVP